MKIEFNFLDDPSPFRPLHPTLKKCKCGLVCERAELYRHFHHEKMEHNIPAEYYRLHGEVPLNEGDV